MAGHQRTADTPAGGGRADGRTPRRAEDGGGGAILYYGWAYMLTLWGKGGTERESPNAEAGKVYQHLAISNFISRREGRFPAGTYAAARPATRKLGGAGPRRDVYAAPARRCG